MQRMGVAVPRELVFDNELPTHLPDLQGRQPAGTARQDVRKQSGRLAGRQAGRPAGRQASVPGNPQLLCARQQIRRFVVAQIRHRPTASRGPTRGLSSSVPPGALARLCVLTRAATRAGRRPINPNSESSHGKRQRCADGLQIDKREEGHCDDL